MPDPATDPTASGTACRRLRPGRSPFGSMLPSCQHALVLPRCWRTGTLPGMDSVEAYRLLIADVYELAGTSRRTSDRMAAEHGQTAARWHVLSVIADEPHGVPAIAHRLGHAR